MADWDVKLIEGGPGSDFRLYRVKAVDLSVPQSIPIPCAGWDLATVAYQSTGTTAWTTAVVIVKTSHNGETEDTFSPSVAIGGAAVTNGVSPLIFLCARELRLCVTTVQASVKADFYVMLKKGQYSTATAHNFLSATHPDTLADSPVLGDLIAGNATPAWARLAGSTASQRAILTQTGSGLGTSAAPAWLADNPLLYLADVRARALTPPTVTWTSGSITVTALVSGTAYFVYLGRIAAAVTPKFVRFFMATAGSGAQTAEIGLFSTTTGPQGGTLTLSKLVATGTLDDLTAAPPLMRGNSSAFATSIPAGTYLWAGIRTALASSQPSGGSTRADFGQGAVLSTAAAGALTGAGPWSGSVLANPNDPFPGLLASLD